MINENNYQKIEKSLRFMLESFKINPSIEELAKNVSLSKFHYLRIFKEYTGITPKQFLNFLIFNESQKYLKNKSILKTANLLNIESTSKLHNLYVNISGVTPEEWKRNGKGVKIFYGFGDTIFGKALIGIISKGICYLGFVGESLEIIFEDFVKTWGNGELIEDKNLAQEYLDKIFIKKEKFNIFIKGTNFQMKVWEALLKIPEGDLTTYSEISNILQNPLGVRAVASAIGSNHIGYLIPCHRVISKMGLLSGYKWGIEKKEMIIFYEGGKNHKIK